MQDEGPTETENKPGERRRDPAAALARAMWSEQILTDTTVAPSREARAADWRLRRKAYASQARRILQRLEEQGYSLAEKP